MKTEITYSHKLADNVSGVYVRESTAVIEKRLIDAATHGERFVQLTLWSSGETTMVRTSLIATFTEHSS